MPVDPNAIKTWANLVTVLRVLMAPVVFVLIPAEQTGHWGAFALWFVLCLSDSIDGHLARRHGATNLGAFLDPLADKVLVLGAMFFLVHSQAFPIVPVVLITAREVVISLYRTFVGAKGVSVPASRLAKWKTLVQQFAVGLCILPLTVEARWLWLSVLWASVVLTLVSGAQYLWRARAAETPVAPSPSSVG
ncbi:MAG: CDP-diacylglycerol--glycerol-3-phosphate 3-phosphatidyltransferase [Ilumatobacteraceae bacterium]